MNGLPLLEAAYDLEAGPRERVVRLLAAAAATFAEGRPVLGCAIPPEWDVAAVPREDLCAHGADAWMVQACLEVGAAMPREERLALYHAGPACIVTAAAFRYSPSLAVARSKGVADMVALLGNSGDGGGVTVWSPSAEAMHWPARLHAYWSLVAQHLGAAWRLASRLCGSPGASFTPGGACRDLAPAAASPSAREALRAAVLQREAARDGKRSADPAALWPAVVDGRWTLVDAFTAGGSRYVVAHENPAGSARLRAVEPRARVVLDHLLAGRSGKWIALELGISEATVARRARSALRSLGVHDLAFLAGVRAAMFEPLAAAGDAALVVARLAPLASAVADLSRAERDIMAALAAGKATHAIARERGTSARTVANQLASIYRKAGVTSRRELLARFG